MKYIYLRIYQILKRVKTNDTPALNSLILFVALQAFNILSLIAICNFFKFLRLDKNQTIIFGLSLYTFLLVPNYFFLYRKLEIIIKKYSNEPKEKRQRGSILVISYILLSIIFFFVIGENLH